jgi:hypothetical protein
METQFGHERYWTTYVDDPNSGFAGVHLHRDCFGKTALAAHVVFWDAAGHFAIQTFDGDVPVEIIEALIAEAKEQVRVR